MIKKQEGFTLMEMIISVGTLALISGFILQMFIVSENVNQKARNTDVAATIVVHAVEAIKRQRTLDDYMLDDFYRESVTENDMDQAQEPSQLRIIKCYDKNWNALDVSQFDDDERVRYSLTVTVQKEIPLADEKITSSSGMFCVIHAEVSDVKAEKQKLADVNASKYFNLWVIQ